MGSPRFEDFKPVLAMVCVQFIVATTSVAAKAALMEGVSLMVFLTYRQLVAALVLAPTILLRKRGRASKVSLGMKGFCLVFVAALFGVTLGQIFYCLGLQMASASAGGAVSNTIPAITFIMTVSIGLEKVQLRSRRSIAKVLGTIICVGGAISMALFKGPKFLSTDLQTLASTFHKGGDDWKIGCLLIFGSNCCWSLWLILQVPICEKYCDPLSLSTWMCLFGALQTAIPAFFLVPDLRAWKINATVFLYFLYAGTVGSGVLYYIQSWCISRRGPLFVSVFSPLCTVIVTISATLLLHEQLYVGSLVGAVAVVFGLYVVLWGKAKDFDGKREARLVEDHTKIIVSIDRSTTSSSSSNDEVNEPLLIN